MISKLRKPIGVVSHDAGGANQLLAAFRTWGMKNVIAYFEGPAARIWSDALPSEKIAPSLDVLMRHAGSLVSGTGWESTLEHDARCAARARGLIWVVDEFALALATNLFSKIPVLQIKDFYAEQESARITPLDDVRENEFLYLLEPARSTWGRGELGEFQALKFFLSRLKHLDLPIGTTIRLRPHPSEKKEKYSDFLHPVSSYPIMIDEGGLFDALSRARWVAGCQTYAMSLALKTGRQVYCTLPSWAPACMLPHPGIIHLKDGIEP